VAVYPIRGAGVVADIEDLHRRGQDRSYCRIELTSYSRTSVMMPVSDAEQRSVRETWKQP
jgi:RNA polymerase-interacting CarD/CdnL/TRCF family regulator